MRGIAKAALAAAVILATVLILRACWDALRYCARPRGPSASSSSFGIFDSPFRDACGSSVVRARGWIRSHGLATRTASQQALRHSPLSELLTLENLKARQGEWAAYREANPVSTIALYMGGYILVAALSLPGATALTLAGGALFGFWLGTLIISFSSTIGATLAFLISRSLLRDWVQRHFGRKLSRVNEGVKREGAFYLFTLRLVPIFPFFAVNLVMGLTPLRVGTFFVVSQIGMLPGTAAYVNAGTQLAHLSSLKGILSGRLLASFVLIGILPLLSKWLVAGFRSRKHRRRLN